MHVYEMDDYTWWAGESLESVVADYLKETGVSRDEIEPMELTDEEMNALIFVDDPGNTSGASRSFAEQLGRMIAEGATFPCFFATTEY
jgi:hypothetical protein